MISWKRNFAGTVRDSLNAIKSWMIWLRTARSSNISIEMGLKGNKSIINLLILDIILNHPYTSVLLDINDSGFLFINRLGKVYSSGYHK